MQASIGLIWVGLCVFTVGSVCMSMKARSGRRSEFVALPPSSPGVSLGVSVLSYGPENAEEMCYIHAALHADELPGLLVVNHLIKDLDELESRGRIDKRIVVLPYANPIGLQQDLLGNHIGRFSFATGTNFNRDFGDYTRKIVDRIKDGRLALSKESSEDNVARIRECLLTILEEEMMHPQSAESFLKKTIFKMASVSDICLDLHCDTNALLHIYTHTRLWPQMRDLAGDLGAWGTLLAEESGGTPLDEACSGIWAQLQDLYEEYKLPMACQSVTVELRGGADVNDELAKQDTAALKNFLTRRGYIRGDDEGEMPPLIDPPREASPLTGVEMIHANAHGILVFKKALGDWVKPGDVVGEIVSIEDVDAPRTEVKARSEGLLFVTISPGSRLVRPGQILMKVAGDKELPWREGNLLTAK